MGIWSGLFSLFKLFLVCLESVQINGCNIIVLFYFHESHFAKLLFMATQCVPIIRQKWTNYFALFSIIEIGLDQEITMPDDSHVLKYFTHLKSYLSVGPPVYFVLNNTKYQLDFTQKNIQNKICGGQGCNPDSLQSQIKLWSKKPNITYIGSPAQSWIDDYFGWSKDCCNVNDGEFCPSNKETGKNYSG